MNWDDLKFLLAVKRGKTLKAAGAALKVDQATVGRRLQALEKGLGTQLLEKTPAGFVITAAGEAVLPAAEEIEARVLGLEREIAGRDEKVEGTLRIAAPGSLADHWLIPRLPAFTKLYPQLRVELLTGARVLNLSRREADCAIRFVRPSHAGLVFRKVGRLRLSLYAGPGFFPKKARPESLDDLRAHRFVALHEEAQSELEAKIRGELNARLKPALTCQNWSSVLQALRAGLGFGILPSFLAAAYPELEEIPVLPAAESPVWLVVHPDLARSRKLRAASQFLHDAFQSTEL
jgi:DNA-binding transcriptional LysR family regulator